MKVLETERLRLRPFTDDDLDIHRVVFSDPEVCRWYCGKTRTEAETREWLIHRRWQVKSEDQLGFLAVVRKADSQILGLVALQPFVGIWLAREEASPLAPLVVELSYAFGQAYQKQGYATEACCALIAYGFQEMRIPRLTNAIAEENQASWRLCERLGFRRAEDVRTNTGGPVWILDNVTIGPTSYRTDADPDPASSPQ